MNSQHVKVDTFGPSDELSEIARRFSEPIASRIDRLIGVLDRHPEQWEKYAQKYVTVAAGLASGAIVLNQWMFEPAFDAKSIIIDNLSSYWLYIPKIDRLIPPQTTGFVVACIPSINTMSLGVFAGSSTVASTVILTPTERVLGPSGAGSPASSSLVMVGGIPTMTPVPLPAGQAAGFSLDLLGNLRTTIDLLSGEDPVNDLIRVEAQFLYAHISTNTTTIMKVGSGLIHGVTCGVNSGVGTIVLYDNTAGSGQVIYNGTPPPVGVTLLLDERFFVGLTAVTTSTGSAADINIAYR